jgi:hypothetical protein
MNKVLLTVPQFCEVFSISRARAYEEMKAQRLRKTKLGRATRIAVTDAQAWLEAIRAGSAQTA